MHIVLNLMETIVDALALPHFVRQNDLWNHCDPLEFPWKLRDVKQMYLQMARNVMEHTTM